MSSPAIRAILAVLKKLDLATHDLPPSFMCYIGTIIKPPMLPENERKKRRMRNIILAVGRASFFTLVVIPDFQ